MIEWVSRLTIKVVKFVGRVEEQALAPVESSLLFIAFSIVETCTSIKVINRVISYNRIMALVGT